METRAQLRLLLGHSHAVFNVWRGSHLHPANEVGNHHQVIASTCPPYPQATWSAFFFRAVSPWLGWTIRETMSQIMGEIVRLSPMWRFWILCSSAPFDKVYAPHGIVNALPTRNHALSHAIFHLRVHRLPLVGCI